MKYVGVRQGTGNEGIREEATQAYYKYVEESDVATTKVYA